MTPTPHSRTIGLPATESRHRLGVLGDLVGGGRP